MYVRIKLRLAISQMQNPKGGWRTEKEGEGGGEEGGRNRNNKVYRIVLLDGEELIECVALPCDKHNNARPI